MWPSQQLYSDLQLMEMKRDSLWFYPTETSLEDKGLKSECHLNFPNYANFILKYLRISRVK